MRMAALQFFLAEGGGGAVAATPGLSDAEAHAQQSAECGELGVLLLQAKTAAKAKTEAKAGTGDPYHPSDFFGNFAEMESTYTEQGLRGMDEVYSFDPGLTGSMDEVLSADSFHESPSAGNRAAFQSHYPTVSTDFGQSTFPLGFSSVVNENTWKETAEDNQRDFWVQEYSHSPITGKSTGFAWPQLTGRWFDSSLDQIDGYGRKMMPFPGTGERLSYFSEGANNWHERAVNTTVTCEAIGCLASSYLQVYDPAREEAASCRMSFGVHATDFDDKDEVVKDLTVNGRLVTSSCQITSGTCNRSAALWPCVTETPVDALLEDGRLLVQASISESVDECPYDGNLLSGVAVVTCMVRNATKTSTSASTNTTNTTVQGKSEGMTSTVSGDLQCDEPGCSASLSLSIDPIIVELGGTCLLTMTVVPTDFDDGLGAPEEIESVLLDGEQVAAGWTPGINPCTAIGTWGRDLANLAAFQNYTVLSEYDITDKISTDTLLEVTANISKHVDDCPYKGHYLYAAVSVDCTYTPSS